MLFDERDMRVFQNSASRSYFKEILQSYYSQNYRATIVLLYSFVIYDLFMKLQTMANEGDKKAIKKIEEINTMISDDEKYSKVENEIVLFFKENCELYFRDFVEDIDYLKNCRNKCAHLKVNDSTLYVPSDYHARMLICSMYDKILSVKAPFILDLFSFAEADVETYSNTIDYSFGQVVEENVKNSIKNKYLSRMTYDSLKKSYKTFIRLNFISDAPECKQNSGGLYVFIFAMTEYIIEKGFTELFKEESILDVFSRITVDLITEDKMKFNMLLDLITFFPTLMDIIKLDDCLFNNISSSVLDKANGLKYYRNFYPREEITAYGTFKKKEGLQDARYIDELFEAIKDDSDFDFDEFIIIMINSIPGYYGFDSADSFMRFFNSHLNDFLYKKSMM